MYKTLKIVVISILFGVVLQGCAPKNSPLPQTKENLDSLLSSLGVKSKKLSLNKNKEREYQILEMFQESVENDLDYNFDKTVRNILLFSNGNQFFQLFYPAIDIIRKNPEDALAKKYISQKTFEVIDLQKKSISLTNNQLEILNLVAKCQSEGSGKCKAKNLIAILLGANIKPTEGRFSMSESKEQEMADNLEYELNNKYQFYEMASNGLLLNADGQAFNAMGFFQNSLNEIKVNNVKLSYAKRLSEIMSEESE